MNSCPRSHVATYGISLFDYVQTSRTYLFTTWLPFDHWLWQTSCDLIGAVKRHLHKAFVFTARRRRLVIMQVFSDCLLALQPHFQTVDSYGVSFFIICDFEKYFSWVFHQRSLFCIQLRFTIALICKASSVPSFWFPLEELVQ